MENKPNHPQEDQLFPEEELLFPVAEEDPEEIPMIEELSFGEQAPSVAQPVETETVSVEELSFDAEPAAMEEVASEEVLPVSAPEAAPAEVEAPIFPEEEPAFVIGTTPVEDEVDIPSFMDRIPDVEDITEPSANPVLPAQPEEPAAPIPQEEAILEQVAPVPEASSQEPAYQEYRDDAKPEPTAQKAEKDNAARATLKGRPKRKKGEGLFGIPNILATFVWLALILVIGVTLGRMLWVCAADVLAFGREDKRVTITVYEADTMDDIIDKLYEGGLIRYKSLFRFYADISDAEEEIQPGIYDLNTRYDYHALVNFMAPSSTREVVEVTIPEGYTCRQIFALLEENRVCTAVDIAAYAASGELSDYWFLEGLERGGEYCLEGYLFPDTYQFYKNSSPREALEKMLDNFDHRFSEDMRARIDVLNADVTDGTYGIREIVIVASLIEKESAAASESPMIASVIYNRLFNWEYPALLNIDAAIVYAQGGNADVIDTSIDSPYNTYRYTGLTPTPISNPGLSSIKAALNPDNTNYYYYVLNPSTGMHQFSTTQAEHDAWIDTFYG